MMMNTHVLFDMYYVPIDLELTFTPVIYFIYSRLLLRTYQITNFSFLNFLCGFQLFLDFFSTNNFLEALTRGIL